MQDISTAYIQAPRNRKNDRYYRAFGISTGFCIICAAVHNIG